MQIIEALQKAWKDVKKPTGFVADIRSKSEAEMEFGDIERYFSGLSWQEVNPDAKVIRYMSPLLWMNDNAAQYYSLSFLIFLVSPQALKTIYETPNMTVQYFTDSEFSILSKMSKHQQKLAQQAIEIYQQNESTS